MCNYILSFLVPLADLEAINLYQTPAALGTYTPVFKDAVSDSKMAI